LGGGPEQRTLSTNSVAEKAAISLVDARPNLTAAAAVIALTGLAWANRFIQDDAFISFRYAYNAVQGLGLVWNAGERVEGYTNFLWTVLMTVPHLLHVDPVLFSQLAGLSFFALTLLFTYKTAVPMLGSRGLALTSIIVLGTNFTFSSYATGGLETQMQACLAMVSLYIVLENLRTGSWSIRGLAVFSLVIAVSVLTRPDSVVLSVICVPLAAVSSLRGQAARQRKLAQFAGLFLPALVILSAWMLWKYWYYGSVIPNTFYAKVSMDSSFSVGMNYVSTFFTSYWLWPFALLVPFVLKRPFPDSLAGVLVLTAFVVIWCAYVVVIGGDFMEFRFMVPVLPPLAMLLVWLIVRALKRPMLQACFIGFALVGSLHHALTFEYFRGIESISGLSGHVSGTPVNWVDVGKSLGRMFDYNEDVTIATRASGAISYYSKLRVMDMLGLSDPWIATQGYPIESQPGHKRLAPLDYLVRSGVNLVIGHPVIIDTSRLRLPYYDVLLLMPLAPILRYEDLPETSSVAEIPIDAQYSLVALYLVRSPVVDRVAAQYNWRIVPVVRDLQQEELSK